MEGESLETSQHFKGDKNFWEVASKVKWGEAIATVILKNKLPLYKRAASATGFEVRKIAKEGEQFPGPPRVRGDYYSNIKVQGKGYIAVSVEGPKGVKDYGPFWKKLESLEQEEV